MSPLELCLALLLIFLMKPTRCQIGDDSTENRLTGFGPPPGPGRFAGLNDEGLPPSNLPWTLANNQNPPNLNIWQSQRPPGNRPNNFGSFVQGGNNQDGFNSEDDRPIWGFGGSTPEKPNSPRPHGNRPNNQGNLPQSGINFGTPDFEVDKPVNQVGARPQGNRPNNPGNFDPFIDNSRPPFTTSTTDAVTTDAVTTTMSPCERACPVTNEFNPVCTTDGTSFTNPGRLKCAQNCGKQLELSHFGNCRRSRTTRATPTSRQPSLSPGRTFSFP